MFFSPLTSTIGKKSGPRHDAILFATSCVKAALLARKATLARRPNSILRIVPLAGRSLALVQKSIRPPARAEEITRCLCGNDEWDIKILVRREFWPAINRETMRLY